MHRHVLALLFATTALVPDSPAQTRRVAGGPDPDRRVSTVVVANDDAQTLAAVSISYSQADWKDGYDDSIAQLAGSNYTRLGRGWWTTLDTVGTIAIGGTRIDAGSYYLGLAVAENGAFSLLVFDSKQTMQKGLLPAATPLYTGDARPETRAPLTFARNALQDVVVKLAIEITADQQDPATGKLSIRWGKHELSAPVRFDLAEPKGTVVKKPPRGP